MIAFVSHTKNRIFAFHREEVKHQSLRAEDKTDQHLQNNYTEQS